MKKIFFTLLILYASVMPRILSGQNTEMLYLSGQDKDHTVPWDFKIDGGSHCCEWTTIAVPSNWELRGFGRYVYGLNHRPDEKPADETGIYRHSFQVPASWKKKVVKIVFEGVMTDTRVLINGKSAGPVHRGGFYRFSYDISDLLHYGKTNRLEVTVNNKSSNASVNAAEREADYWIFSGIYRPVYLKAFPRSHIQHTAINALADGSITIDVELNNIIKPARLTVKVSDPGGAPPGETFSVDVKKGQTSVRLGSTFRDIKPWNPEDPNLYNLEITLEDDKGPLHRIRERFGFRTMELRKGDGIYVNGVKIMFKGVDRHSFWPESGRCLSKAISIMDVNLMKDMNMNAVRMSHYPPDTHFLDVCDSLGLFVLDELAGWQAYYDTETARKLVREMVRRDVNHPCIVMWDNGNEGGHNFDVDDDFALYDPQERPVIHPQHIFRGTDTQHYKDYNCCTGSFFHGRNVFFPTEFLHGLYDGGAGAGLEDYWNLMRSNPLSAGGFIWVFADEGVVRVDRGGQIDTHGNNAPDGIVGPYREKEGSFYTIREIWSPVVIHEPFLSSAFDGKLTLENRYFYTDLSSCTLTWELSDILPPEEGKTLQKIRQSKVLRLPEAGPGTGATADLELPPGFREYDVLSVRVTDRYGRQIYDRSWPLKTPWDFSLKMLPAPLPADSLPKVEAAGDRITVHAGKLIYTFDKNTGTLSSVLRDGKVISFGGGPVPDIGKTNYTGMKWKTEDGNIIISLQYDEKIRKADFIVEPDGLLRLEFAYNPGKGRADYLGIHFTYPEKKIQGIRWTGDGPYRVWKNRMRGPFFGYWIKAYNNTITGERGWIYPEFKGYYSHFYHAILENGEHPFSILCESEDIFLRLYTPEPPHGASNHRTDGIFPPGDISFLHGIAPIGTKFTDADHLGPQGEKNILSGTGSKNRDLEINLIFDFR